MSLRKHKKRRNPGYILLSLGVLVIFTSSMFNALHSGHFEIGRSLSHRVYIFDLISTLGVIVIPWGLYLIMKKEESPGMSGLSSPGGDGPQGEDRSAKSRAFPCFSTFDCQERPSLHSHRN